MKHADLPERWKKKIAAYLRARGEDRTELSTYDFFASTATLKFDDGSSASFNWVVVIEAPELNEMGVFTEHCGYHIFPLGGTHVLIGELT